MYRRDFITDAFAGNTATSGDEAAFLLSAFLLGCAVMTHGVRTVAFIDGADLYRGVKSLEWELDYQRFRVWLSDKYGVVTAYLFIGLVPKYVALYTQLQQAGFVLVFKETTVDTDGTPKGNCDAELVLKAVSGFYEHGYGKAVVISSDGDFACLVQFLKQKKAFCSLISPHKQCSFLLRRLNVRILYLDTQKSILVQKKPPTGTKPCKGLFMGIHI